MYINSMTTLFTFLDSNGKFFEVSDRNSSLTFVELLRGRDGLPGRDGVRGPPGPPGPQGKEGPGGPKCGGVAYTRWGKSTCPNGTRTEEVYSGIAVGEYFQNTGGGGNYLCMPRVPEYTLPHRMDPNFVGSFLNGVEYESPVLGHHNHNAPSAVCYVSTRSTVIMIPAKTSCPATWTREYYGYLMAERNIHKNNKEYVCVDQAMESLPGSFADINAASFTHTVPACGWGLPCPPYVRKEETNCVVCTK